MKKTILMAAGAAVAAVAATSVQAVEVDLYGQVNKAVMAVDDGEATSTHFVDNDKSSSRIGVRGEQALDNGLTASVLFEFQSESNSSASVNGLGSDDSANGNGSLQERHSRVGLAGGFGAVYLGQTSTATDGIAEIDLAGASDVMGSYVARFGSSVAFRNSTTGAATAVTLGSVSSNLDGISTGTGDRASALAYHSPIVNGFQARMAAVQGGTIDTAVRYSGKVDAVAVKAGLGYVSHNEAANASNLENTISGSVSAKHDNGLGGTLAYGVGTRDGTGNDDAENLYVKVGYTWDAFEVAADYGNTEELSDATNSEAKSYGVAGQYNLGNGVSVAAMYRTSSLEDNTAVKYEDINVFLANMKVKF